MHRYKDLKVWKKAVDLSYKVYEVTKEFPSEERFGLTSQMRRSAVSIASNIAEGAGRNTDGEFIQFLGISQGSAFELETQTLIASEMNFIEKAQSTFIIDEINSISNMIFKLKQNLKS